MPLNELALEIYIAMLCINGGILMVDALQDTPLKTPFDIAPNVTGANPPLIFNVTDPTGTLVQNLTNATITNSTIGGLGSLIPADPFQPFAVVWSFIQFLTGGFIFEALGIFGFPPIFIFVFQGIFGLLLARIVIYYWLGR